MSKAVCLQLAYIVLLALVLAPLISNQCNAALSCGVNSGGKSMSGCPKKFLIDAELSASA